MASWRPLLFDQWLRCQALAPARPFAPAIEARVRCVAAWRAFLCSRRRCKKYVHRFLKEMCVLCNTQHTQCMHSQHHQGVGDWQMQQVHCSHLGAVHLLMELSRCSIALRPCNWQRPQEARTEVHLHSVGVTYLMKDAVSRKSRPGKLAAQASSRTALAYLTPWLSKRRCKGAITRNTAVLDASYLEAHKEHANGRGAFGTQSSRCWARPCAQIVPSRVDT